MEPPYTEARGWQRLRASLKTALNRNVNLLIGGGALFNLPLGFIFVAFPVYLKRLPSIPGELVGIPITMVGGVAVAVMIPLGILADRFGRRRMLILGGISAALAFFLLSFVDTFEGVLLAAAILGLAEAFYFSTWNALLADASTPQTRSTVFGISFFAAGIALAIGSLIGWFADRAIQLGATPQEAYQPLLLTLAILMLPVPAFILPLRLERHRPEGPRPLLPRRSLGIIGRFFVANMLVGFGAGLLIPLLSMWFFLQFDAGETFTGPLYAVSSIVNAFAFLVAPSFARRVGIIRFIVSAQVVATILLFTMPFSPALGVYGLMTAAILFVARNALMNMAWPVLSYFLMGAVHPDDRATASAVTGASFRAPNAASTTLGGYLFTLDLALPFYVTTLFYALGTGAFWHFFKGYPTDVVEEIPSRPSERVEPK